LVSFQVTRRRRNRSGVSQSPICRAAIRWRIQISSCTPNPVGDAEVVRQQRSGGSVDNFITDPPPRPNRGPYRRDLRRLPQELRKNRRLRSLLILLLSARYPRHHISRLGYRPNAGGVEWVERHGCRESAARTWMSVQRGPTERRRSEGTATKESPNREPGHLVTWGWYGIPAFK
jgi:hypothetical protein